MPERRAAEVAIVGMAETSWLPEHDAVLDELVFDVTYRALRQAGLRKQDLGLSVTASMDVWDGRSISSGLTTPAAGGYLSDGYRLEADAGAAVIAAAQAIAAGDADVAVAVGVHNPEISEPTPGKRRAFAEQVSNLAFEPHADRPVALTSLASLAMHAGARIEADELTRHDLARLAAAEITRGAARERAVRRTAVEGAQVLDAPPVHGPLTELMLPADTTGAVAIVLASRARAERCPQRRAWLAGWGQATGRPTGDGEWWRDPCAPVRRATAEAHRRSGTTGDDLVMAEFSAMTPALIDPLVDALGVGHLDGAARSPSGGVRAHFAGLANGGVRLLEAVEELERTGRPGVALVHSSDSTTGPIDDSVTVLVVESA